MIVELENRNRVGYITLNRPEKKNALNKEMVEELGNVFSKAIEDDAIKVIVLQSRGDVFCSGADLQTLQQLQNYSYEENLEDSTRLKNLMYKIYQCPKPVICKMQGPAIAGGAGIVTLCDFVFATPESKIGYTEVRIGFVPAIVMIFLIRKLGEGKANELLLTGDLIDANSAKSFGLVNWTSDANKIDDDVDNFAAKLVKKNSGQSMALTKQLIREVQDKPIEDALQIASEKNAEARSGEDCKKGIDAFLNKKKIEW